MQQHWTSKPNHSCILHEIKQYQLLHCVQTVLLSVSLLVFHTEPKTVTAEWCFICSIYVDFMWCSCGMQEIWRYCKGHTRKCAGCIIRIKLFWGKVILTYGHRSGCDWSDLCMKWMSGFHCHWIGLMLKEKKNTSRNSITFIRWHKSEQSMEAEWWVFFLYDQSDINFVKGNDIFVCSQFVRSHWYHAVQIIHNIYLFFGGR